MKNFLRRLCVVVLTLAMCLPTLPMTVYAAAGQEPAHSKTVTANDDGSFTIALNVTGDSEKNVTKVNVVVALDSSGSMRENTGNTETTYTATDGNGNNLYGLVDGNYVSLHMEREWSGGWGGNWVYTYYYPWTGSASTSTVYTGQRYTQQTGNQTRMEAAQDAVNALGKALLSNNGGDNPSDTVEIALIDFDTHASAQPIRTTYSQFESDVNATAQGGGTNWEAALTAAKGVDFEDGDDEKTYIIFVSDGNPTFRDSANGYTQDWRQSDQVYGTGQDSGQGSADNITRCYNAAKLVADTIVADDSYVLYTIGVYGNVDRMENLGGTYYAADNTAALQDALNKIWEDIMLAGIGSVEIDDGTTTKVSAGDVDVALITIDESSFKYYRAGGDDGEGNDKYDSTLNGGLGEEWTGDDVPPAKLDSDTGTVIWDMGDGVLENEVTYTVTFVAWPSQYALDLMADIKNDPSAYDKLGGDVKDYFTRDGKIMTNTGATISYTDTRTGETTSQAFNPVEPQATESVESLAISKDWSNLLDPQTAKIPTSVAIYVNRDEEQAYKLVLSEGNSWKSSAYISIGVMTVDKTTGKVDVKATGHDFTFSEDSDVAYTWEIVAPTVHPMKINGTNYSLVLQEKAVAGDDGSMYQKIGSDEYYRLTSGGAIYKAEPIASGGAAAELNASNERRSFFDLQKKVNGDANPDDLFRFELTVDNLDVTTPTEDDDAWFSVWDNSIGGLVKDLDTNATPEENPSNGYYHFADGGSAYVMMKAGQSLRVLNTKTNTQITVKEVLETGGAYTMDTMEFTKRTGNETSETLVTTSSAVENTILIDQTNTAYKMVYTNDYGLGALKITKTVDGVSMSAISSDASFTITDGANYTTTVAFSKFEATNPSDSAVKTYTVYDLNPGTTYTVSEAGFAVKDYKLTTTGLESGKQVTKGGTAEFDVKNTYTRETGALTITKTVEGLDADVTAPEFKFTVAGDELTTETSITLAQGATSGSITLSDLPTGTYTVTEDTTDIDVTNYTRDTAASTTTASATVAVDTTASAVINNVYSKDMGTLKITKVVKGITPNGYTATFEVKDADGDTVTTQSIEWAATRALPVEDVTTSKSAVVMLPVGSYTVTETTATAVEDYVYTVDPESKEQEVTVSKGAVSEVTITNIYAREAGSLTIEKTFSGLADGTSLPAIEFKVSGPDGYSTTLKYDEFEDGKITIIKLPSGTYTVEESGYEVPGYTHLDTSVTTASAVVSEGTTVSAVLKNNYEKDLGSIKITKTVTGVDSAKATDLKFTVTATKTETGENYTTEVAFSKFAPEASKALKALKPLPIDTETTTTVVYTISDLPIGTYAVSETGTAIDGYDLDSSSDTAEKSVTVTKGGIGQASFTNVYAQLGNDLTIIKKVSGLTTTEKLPTYNFEVAASDGTVVTTASITLEEGETSGSAIVKNLPAGTYTVTELTSGTAIDGYTLTAPSAETVVIDDKEENATPTAILENVYSRIVSTLKITKTVTGLDEGTDPVVTFKISGPEDFGEEGAMSVTYGAFTDGEFTITGAPFGDYSVEEELGEMPGYTFIKEDSVTTTSGSIEGDEILTLALTNVYSKDLGALTITKKLQGADADQLPDLTFIVTADETDTGEDYSTEIAFTSFDEVKEEAADTGTTTKAVRSLKPIPVDETKDTEWTFTLSGLPVGTYSVTETGTAIDGYVMNSASVTSKSGIEVSEGTTASAILTNIYQQLGDDLTITKTVTGLVNGETIPAFQFEVTNGEGEVVTTVSISGLELDTPKSVTVADLPAGTYTVTELETTGIAIEGYTLDIPTPQAIEISEESDEREAEFENVYERITGTLTISKSYEGLGEGMTPDVIILVTGPKDFGNDGELELSYEDLDENGEFTTTAPFGEYEISEQVLDIDGYTFLEDESTTSAIAEIVENGDEAELALYNKYEQDLATLVITKTIVGLDKDDFPKGLTFTVTGKLDSGDEDFTTEVAFADFGEAYEAPVKAVKAVRHLDPDESKSTTKSYVLEGIPTGEYTVTETGAAVEDFFLTQSDDVTVTLEKDATEEVKFTNTYGQEVGDVTVIKVVEGDAEDAPEGTTFELQDAEGNVVASATYGDFEEDEDGNMSYTFTDVIVGSYTVVEDEDSAQLDGYDLVVKGNDTEAQDLSDEGTLTFTITNTYTAQTGTVTIKKTVNDGFTVPDGATFIITGDLLNGETFKETVTYADFDNGVFVIEDAPAGTYKVIENASSASISGVTLSISGDNNASKDLEGNGEVEFEIINSYVKDTASFTIVKTSKGHKTPDSAEFTISSDSEYFVKTTIKYSDFTDGKYEFKDVPVGTYTIVEDEKSAAVSGYSLDVEYATGKSIVLDLGENVEFEIINTYEKNEPPTPPVLDTENHDAYIIGYPDGTVQPEGNITRAEVVTIFFRLLTDKSRSQYWETDNDFDDVNVENWFNNAVSTMANAGIIKGYEDGKFRPYNDVTRAELATMAARFLTDTKGGNDSKNYSDTEDSWAKAEIELASRYGIVNGYDDGTFKPNQAITRAEAMTLINRLLKRNPHEDHLLKNMITWPDNADKSVWYYAQVQEATNGHTYTWGSDGNGKYEYWKGLRKVRDWAALETEWANANSGK